MVHEVLAAVPVDIHPNQSARMVSIFGSDPSRRATIPRVALLCCCCDLVAEPALDGRRVIFHPSSLATTRPSLLPPVVLFSLESLGLKLKQIVL